jgi:hypothetical protein
MPAKRICSIEDCGRLAHCRDWCQRHYEQWRSGNTKSKSKKARGRPPSPPVEPADFRGIGGWSTHLELNPARRWWLGPARPPLS